MSGKPVPVEIRFWPKVAVESPGCWLWTASVFKNGYGQFHVRHGSTSLAHRVSWGLLVGPLPSSVDLDHLCRVRRCVNPDHLLPSSRSENLRRGAGPATSAARMRRIMSGPDVTRDAAGRVVTYATRSV